MSFLYSIVLPFLFHYFQFITKNYINTNEKTHINIVILHKIIVNKNSIVKLHYL